MIYNPSLNMKTIEIKLSTASSNQWHKFDAVATHAATEDETIIT